MDEQLKTIRSPDFRKTYQRLTEKVVVTVHGHPIGVWEPYAILRQSDTKVETHAWVEYPAGTEEKEG